MNEEVLDKMIRGKPVTDADIAEILTDICDREHSSCNDECPVYKANGHAAPSSDKPFKSNRGCDCFKNGAAMLRFLRWKQNVPSKNFLLCCLTDGTDIIETRKMTEDEFVRATKNAKDHTDGNFQWLKVMEYF
jgi:hypothetical protein